MSDRTSGEMTRVRRQHERPGRDHLAWRAYLVPAYLAWQIGAAWGSLRQEPLVAALVALLVFGATGLAAPLIARSRRVSSDAPVTIWYLLLAGSLLVSALITLVLGAESPRGVNRLLDLLLAGVTMVWAIGGLRRAPAGPRPVRQGSLRAELRTAWVRSRRFWCVGLIAAAVGGLLMLPLPSSSTATAVSYTFFREQVAAGTVAEVSAVGVSGLPGTTAIYGRFTQPLADPAWPATASTAPTTTFSTIVPPIIDQAELSRLLNERGVRIATRFTDAQAASRPGVAAPTLVETVLSPPIALLLAAGLLWTMQGRGGRMGPLFGVGRSQARRYDAEAAPRPITLADVAGIDEAKQDLAEVVEFLKHPGRFAALGARIPKGVLLVGPPGTGKTLLARAVAGEAGVPFFSISGSEFVEMFVGVGASRVRDLFDQARRNAPCIVFIDEIDAIGRQRGSNAGRTNDEREQTLNQILVAMDGFDAAATVIVVAATNRADVLDPALVRPGRFDRQIMVQPPDRIGRAAILAVHAQGVPLDPNVDLGAVAGATPGLVGAELRNLVNEAALLAVRRGHQAVTGQDFTDAGEKIALGAERRLALTAAERERVAYHEAGHALLGLLQPEGDPVRRVTVVPRGRGLGVTLSVPEDDRYNYSEAYLRGRIVSMLGGRAAEELVYGVGTTGAENDIKQATRLARAMVTRWGMSREIGLVAFTDVEDGNFLDDGMGGGRACSEQTAQAIDGAVRRIIDESYATALDLLTRERGRLESLTRALLDAESLDGDEILAAAGLQRAPRLPAPPPAEAMAAD